MKHLTLIAVLAGLLAVTALSGAPAQSAEAPVSPAAPATGPSSITVNGPTGPLVVSAADLAAMPREEVKAVWHGKAMTFGGVLLSDLLAKVGAPSGEALHGAWLGAYVVVRAADGYTVALSLAETNAGLTGRKVILADTVDAKPLPSSEGPVRLVVEGDTRAVRSARMVQSVDIRSAAAPRAP
jgi:DMSO/TMAO reductase YedYZ molybdopterin-dependent catalytic subunit